MVRLRKRNYSNSAMAGLFDNLEANIFPELDNSVVETPAAREAMLKSLDEMERERSTTLFDTADDTLLPMDEIPNIDRLQFISFGSGSSGNSAYIGNSTTGLLIDAGVDSDKVVAELRRNGIGMNHVKGILLTHDHSDHVRYVYSFVRKYRHLAVYCTPRTLNGMLRRHNISNRIKDYHRAIYKEHPFKIGEFEVLAFEVMHDGTDNAGFHIKCGSHTLVAVTDLGCISDRADYYMRQANYLMIEANYDEQMLRNGSYPEYLKARIKSDIGHLCNDVTAEYIARIYSPTLKQIFLCHLSKDNNTPALALKAVETALKGAGVTQVGDGSETPYARMAPVQLRALPRFDATGLIVLRKD